MKNAHFNLTRLPNTIRLLFHRSFEWPPLKIRDDKLRKMETFVHALSAWNPQTTEGQQAEVYIVDLKSRNPVLFIQFLTEIFESPNLLSEATLAFAITISRSVLPSKIPLFGNPIEVFPNDVINSLLSSLYKIFVHSNDRIRLFAAVTFGHFAMFRIHFDPNASNIFDTLLQPFANQPDTNSEPLASSCATAIDRILREVKLDSSQRQTIFNITFNYICNDNCSNITRAIVIGYLSEFIPDLHSLIQDNSQLFALNMQKLAMNQLVADSIFLVLSESVNKCYAILQYMTDIANLSIHYLQEFRNKDNLTLNILRFWIKVSSLETKKKNSFKICDSVFDTLTPCFIDIFAQSSNSDNQNNSEKCVSIDETWDYYSASYTAIINFSKASPLKAFNSFCPIIFADSTPPLVVLHCTLSILLIGSSLQEETSDNNEDDNTLRLKYQNLHSKLFEIGIETFEEYSLIANDCKPFIKSDKAMQLAISTQNEFYKHFTSFLDSALELAMKALNSNSPKLINHGILILIQILSNKPFDLFPTNEFLKIGFQFLNSNDDEICKNASTLIDLIFHLAPEQDIINIIFNIFQFISQLINSNSHPFAIFNSVNLFIAIVRKARTYQLDISLPSLLQSILQTIPFIFNNNFPDEIADSFVDLLATVVLSLKANEISEYIDQITKIFINSFERGNIVASLNLSIICCIRHFEMFKSYMVDSTLKFINICLCDLQNYQGIIAALRCLISIIPRVQTLQEIIPSIITQLISILSSPEVSHLVTSETLETFSTIIIYYKELTQPYLMTIIDFINEASDLMMKPLDNDEPSLKFTSSVVECASLILQCPDDNVIHKIIPISLKILKEVTQFQYYNRGLSIGIIDMLSFLIGKIPQDQFHAIIRTIEMLKFFYIIEESSYDDLKSNIRSFFTYSRSSS